jgi:hypothetical protein
MAKSWIHPHLETVERRPLSNLHWAGDAESAAKVLEKVEEHGVDLHDSDKQSNNFAIRSV